MPTVSDRSTVVRGDPMTDSTEHALSEEPSGYANPPLDYRRIEVIDPEIAEIMRGKTVPQKISIMTEANRTMRAMIAGRLRSDNPTWDKLQIESEVARRMLNADSLSG